MEPINRRTTLRLAMPATFALAGARPVVAEPIDGKGNDVCPCFFDVDEAVLDGDAIEVSGPCAVANPPEEATVRVQVRGDRGARAIGDGTFVCTARERGDDEDTFSVTAAVRGANRFVVGHDVRVHAKVRLDPDDAPAVVGRWRWEGTLG